MPLSKHEYHKDIQWSTKRGYGKPVKLMAAGGAALTTGYSYGRHLKSIAELNLKNIQNATLF